MQSGAAGAADRAVHVSALVPERGREDRFGECLTGGYPWRLQSLSCQRSPVQSLVLLWHSCSNWVRCAFASARVFLKIHTSRSSAWRNPELGLGEQLNPRLLLCSSGSTVLRLLPWKINGNVTNLGCGA